MMKQTLLCLVTAIAALLAFAHVNAQPKPSHNLIFDNIPARWDEALPLGNGWMGALVWQKGDNLRLSLDHVDLWDERPMPKIDQLKFSWVIDQVKKKDYDTVQSVGDVPYDNSPAPTKIPGAALEFNCSFLGKTATAELDISTALATLTYPNGTRFLSYVHADRMTGYFAFEKLPAGTVVTPQLIIPGYNKKNIPVGGNMVVDGQGLEQLGYAAGAIQKKNGEIRYHQPTWKGHYYEVLVQWQRMGKDGMIGAWTITVDAKASLPALDTRSKEPTFWPSHIAWWQDYWNRSSVQIPDTLLSRQYYLEMYKFGSVARANTPPISLQAVWTADNGNLPPWKGDFHHDLNTQLSYWPGYVSNHTDLTASFTNWLLKVKKVNENWTERYFGTKGLNVPGVTTLNGKEMGGWIQYSMSPTVSAWLAQHFYQQYAYTGDEKFLKENCLPYFRQIDQFLNGIAITNDKGKRQLPLSASPEINDNSIDAWFQRTTNYDLALIHNFYRRFAELDSAATGKAAGQLLEKGESFMPLDTDPSGLTVAPGYPLKESHRHHSNLMAIYPLQLLSKDKQDDKVIMQNSFANLQKLGTRAWCGYSFSWAASLYASAGMGDSALRYLHIFAENFCSSNSFHLNGDQKKGQYSNFTYRPFTLEGNFAFAQGIHELLIRSEQGFIDIFPALPSTWADCSFHQLRATGAILVDAVKTNGVPQEVVLKAEKAGKVRIRLPFRTFIQQGISRDSILQEEKGIISFNMTAGQEITFKNAFE
ncbi:glycosyl hydrolase family 95 catalytic domain-containing protein [Flavihumibacter petaseus]|uniref:Uncharacterized protein n=1 Tax=Flavihumibacter petaseus NBRC 106054 TaxID=1220578 RepID=A0A0E9N6P0_9BACT|nr:glycoside hydrolase N-terminal domain-containing protein [Flavihumibacter petaseus]GAO45617.1 hypothetical protein FPE01S_07_00050 [Flavihumibacter petaseus NBRC 106054]